MTVSRDSPTPLADFFARLNDPCIDAFLADEGYGDGKDVAKDGGNDGGGSTPNPTKPRSKRGKKIVVSFSHFVPRQELCPEKRFLSEPMLTKVRLQQ